MINHKLVSDSIIYFLSIKIEYDINGFITLTHIELDLFDFDPIILLQLN